MNINYIIQVMISNEMLNRFKLALLTSWPKLFIIQLAAIGIKPDR